MSVAWLIMKLRGRKKTVDDIVIAINPEITPDQLWDFYVRNDICEVGFGKEAAAKPLKGSSLIVGAFHDNQLVGIARAMFDGLSASIMEFCLDLELQGKGLQYDNGSLIEKDILGVGKKIGDALISELRKMGAEFFNVYVVDNCEEAFYESIGFKENKGHLPYYIDERRYI